MTDREAYTAAGVGMALLLAGRTLLDRGDLALLALWGVAFTILGLVTVVVGAGVLLRLWR